MNRWWLAAIISWGIAARAESSLDVEGWLMRPGVRAVAVEFYASWCKPCMDAMPRWKELQKRYGREGLKVIVVNTRDAGGACANLGWKPDQVVCDIDGVLSERLGVHDLPAAFLWSWQGHQLVQGGHIGEVEAAVEATLKAAPRVEIRAEGALPPAVLAALEARLTDTGKVLVVADEQEREALAKMRLAQQKATVDQDARCELGRELPPNTLLKVARVNGGSEEYLSLELLDVETGCQSAATQVPWDEAEPARAVRDAVENLLAKLRRTPPEWPPRHETHGTEQAPTAQQHVGTLALSVDVDGAALTLDGTPRTDALATRRAMLEVRAGEHRLRISKPGYLDDVRNVAVAAGGRATVDVTLVAEKPVERKPAATDRNAFLYVETAPSGAVLVIDDQPLGRSPGTFELSPGRHVVKARLNWYREAVVNVELEAGVSFAKSIVLVPDFGRLEVVTAQRGVTLALDGTAIGAADPVLKRSPVTPGDYLLRATLPDHHDYETTVHVQANATTLVRVPPLPSSVGALSITTLPSGAAVEIDGQERGRTPVTVDRLVGGTHEVRLSREGCETMERQVEIAEGAQQALDVELDTTQAELTVTSRPVNGTVFIDGHIAGTSPLTVSVAEGEHHIRVEGDHRFHKPWESRVSAVRKQKLVAGAELEPLRGTLVVTSVPFGAEVLIDGEPLGRTPMARALLPTGPHRLELRHRGYRTVRGSVEVGEGKDNRIEVKLVELLGEELAATRLANWKRETAPLRSRAVKRTWLSVGAAALALGSVAVLQSHRTVRDAAFADYQRATTDAGSKYALYDDAWARALAWGSGAGVAVIGAGWLGWTAVQAWDDVPAHPVFEVVSGLARASVEGEW
ncbi:MAG: hypothetical protein RL199_315 [Pseudomonadota bacterium]|jgi:thiol-disulfide isomerase/thioredoxin/CRISPR/Cas system-associated exonuclease Cas4 (RecB family)